MIVFIGIVSHSPTLLPQIIQKEEGVGSLSPIISGYKEMEGRLYQGKPDTLFVVSPHPSREIASFLVNFYPHYKISFPSFGDFENYGEFFPDPLLVPLLRSHMRGHGTPLSTFSEEVLDYGVGIPLCALGGNLREVRVLPFSTSSLLSEETHASFGATLLSPLEETGRRVAILISIDLQKSIDRTGDTIMIERLKQNDLTKLGETHSDNCSLKPLILLSGLLEEIHFETEILSYTVAHDNGILLAQLHL